MRFRSDDTPESEKAAQRRGTSDDLYRATDTPEEGEYQLRRRRRFAARVIFLSIICSGLVALVIVYTVELGARNNAVDACKLEMQTRALLAEQADEAADGVLGDPNENPPVPAFNFEGTSFARFKPLIIAQANSNRRRSQEFRRTIRSCERLFPKPKLFGVFG